MRVIRTKYIFRVWNSKLLFRHRKFIPGSCPIHQSSRYYSSETVVRYRGRSYLSSGTIDMAFLLKWLSGSPSLNISLRTENRREVLPLYSFFRKLYEVYLWPYKINSITTTGSQSYSLEPVSKERQNYLFSVARKLVLQAYHSGDASPQDVDAQGRNLLHVRIILMRLP